MRTFLAIVNNEVRLNSKRAAPYVLMILFAANAVLWWGWGPAVRLGWATNSEYYIVRNLIAFSFLTGMPIFNAVIMSDSVIRDFRFEIAPLLFSKPVALYEYLLGKFVGSFVTLVCCQSAFIVTLIVLQLFRTSQMVVQPFRVWPYFKHFVFYIVISHLFLAAFYFAVGTLTRNAKIVYGLAVCFYPVYIASQIFLLQKLPQRWTIILDPFLLNTSLKGNGFLHSAEFLNQYLVVYTPAMLFNRGLMIVAAVGFLTVTHLLFTTGERVKEKTFSSMNLFATSERVYYSLPERAPAFVESDEKVAIPAVTQVNDGFRATFHKLVAAASIEWRLLRSERSLVVLIPLAIVFSTLEIAFYSVCPEVSYSATYAITTASGMLLFLIGFSVFYTGEAMHREREERIEPLLWSTPAPNIVMVLSKFFSTLLLLCGLIVAIGVSTVTIQIFRGHTPIELSPVLRVYGLILLPSAIFVTAFAVLANVLLRNKHVAYVASIGTAAGLFYLYSVGYNHWLYNPTLFQLWRYANLTESAAVREILWRRAYVVSIAIGCLALSHMLFRRRPATHLWSGRRAAPFLTLIASLIAAVASALMGWKS